MKVSEIESKEFKIFGNLLTLIAIGLGAYGLGHVDGAIANSLHTTATNIPLLNNLRHLVQSGAIDEARLLLSAIYSTWLTAGLIGFTFVNFPLFHKPDHQPKKYKDN